jgi:hypothetical protein
MDHLFFIIQHEQQSATAVNNDDVEIYFSVDFPFV